MTSTARTRILGPLGTHVDLLLRCWIPLYKTLANLFGVVREQHMDFGLRFFVVPGYENGDWRSRSDIRRCGLKEDKP